MVWQLFVEHEVTEESLDNALLTYKHYGSYHESDDLESPWTQFAPNPAKC